MKREYFLLIILITVSINLAYGQTITHPWKVVDNGGGKSTGGELILQTSMGQAAVQRMVHIDTGKVLESGYIPGLRNISGSYTYLDLQMLASWNMVSVPLIASDYRKSTLFPGASSSAYNYDNGYKIKDTLQNGEGYWLKFPSALPLSFQGTGITYDTINVNSNWNMIGALSYPILITDITPIAPVTIQSNYFGYEPGLGYFMEDTLKPGAAYWLKVSDAGKLVLKSGSVLLSGKDLMASQKQKTDETMDISEIAKGIGLESISFTDAGNRERSLYFTVKKVDIDPEKYELPPTPPSGIFDVRYASQRNVEIANPENGPVTKTIPIIINGAKYPLSIAWQTLNDDKNTYKLEVTYNEVGGIKKELYYLANDEKITINKDVSIKLIMTQNSVVEIPKEFSLSQNYPNPFNPTTRIKYDLPLDAKVTIKIFNILGQEVKVLLDDLQSAGYKWLDFNATELSSGVYFYQINATGTTDANKKFTKVNKMMVLK